MCNNNEQGECKCVLGCEHRTHSYAKPQKKTSNAVQSLG